MGPDMKISICHMKMEGREVLKSRKIRKRRNYKFMKWFYLHVCVCVCTSVYMYIGAGKRDDYFTHRTLCVF